jgi:hypothetical protein
MPGAYTWQEQFKDLKRLFEHADIQKNTNRNQIYVSSLIDILFD